MTGRANPTRFSHSQVLELQNLSEKCQGNWKADEMLIATSPAAQHNCPACYRGEPGADHDGSNAMRKYRMPMLKTNSSRTSLSCRQPPTSGPCRIFMYHGCPTAAVGMRSRRPLQRPGRDWGPESCLVLLLERRCFAVVVSVRGR